MSIAALRDAPHVTVLAAIGAETPLVSILRRYTRDTTLATSVTFSSVLRQFKDIEEGKSADIMITAHPKWTQRLKQMGVADVNSINNMMRDELVIVVPVTDTTSYDASVPPGVFLQQLHDLRKPFFVADETISALGLYTKQVFDNALIESGNMPGDGINPLLTQSGYVRMPSEVPDRIIRQKAAGIIYKSTLKRRNDVKKIYDIPVRYHDDIIYQIAVIAGEHMEEARDLARFLTKESTLNQFYAAGFLSLR